MSYLGQDEQDEGGGGGTHPAVAGRGGQHPHLERGGERATTQHELQVSRTLISHLCHMESCHMTHDSHDKGG